MEPIEALNRRYRLLGRGALCAWIGALSLVPGERVPIGVGLLGIGVILLGLNLARRALHRLPACGTDLVLAAIALAAGAAKLLRSPAPFSLGLMIVGAILFARGAWPVNRRPPGILENA